MCVVKANVCLVVATLERLRQRDRKCVSDAVIIIKKVTWLLISSQSMKRGK